ncbi:protein prenylyltransferase [Xylaria curta]|nr:protein prenylyltransferase [Xylaria curta]
MEHRNQLRVAPTARTEEQRQKELGKIKKYRGFEDELRERAARGAFDEPRTYECTTALLKSNPEYYTVWNLRRRCMLGSVLSSPFPPAPASTPEEEEAAAARAKLDGECLDSELDFTITLLKNFPKCYWIWNFRTWVLEQFIIRVPRIPACRAWRNELAYTHKALVQDSRNFHAWGYRRYIVAKLETPALLGHSLLEDEFVYTTRMIEQDLSNFSAWHYRSRLMFRVLEERKADDKARAAFFETERCLIQDALNVGINDQSLWYYYRFLMAQALNPGGRPTIIPNMATEKKIQMIQGEIDWIEDLLLDMHGEYPDLMSPYEALVELTVPLLKIQPDAAEERQENDPRFWVAKIKEQDKNNVTTRWDELERSIERQLAM